MIKQIAAEDRVIPHSTSYHSILKWAKEAKVLLRQKRYDAVRTNLSMIVLSAKEETKRKSKQ